MYYVMCVSAPSLYIKRKSLLFVAFIDLEKAFDSVEHDLLLRKLQDVGVSSKMMTLFQNIFRKSSVVMKKSHISFKFPCIKGVRQGFPSSLSLFISDLDSSLRQNNAASIRIRKFHVTSLMFVNDPDILADSHTGLQQSLNSLDGYCSHLRIKVNANKIFKI